MTPDSPEPLLAAPEPRTPRARRLAVATMFSLDPVDRSGPAIHRASVRAAAALDRALLPGGVAFVYGPSGAGKTSILRALERLLRRRGHPVIVAPPASSFLAERRTPVDLLHSRLDDDLRLLSAVGLAEAPLWLRPARHLSEGQRARLALAVALDRAQRAGRATLIADEFASTLDRVTAMSLCAGLRRSIASLGAMRIVLASAHDDLLRWLRPHVALRVRDSFAPGAFELRTHRRPAA